MAYKKQLWRDGDPGTPLSAARLTHIENGIAALVAPRGPQGPQGRRGVAGPDGEKPIGRAVSDAEDIADVVTGLNSLLGSLREAGYLSSERAQYDFGENPIKDRVLTVANRPDLSVEQWSAVYAISTAAPSSVDKLRFINSALGTRLGEITGVSSIDGLGSVATSGTKLAEVYAGYASNKSEEFIAFESVLQQYVQAVSSGEVTL